MFRAVNRIPDAEGNHTGTSLPRVISVLDKLFDDGETGLAECASPLAQILLNLANEGGC